MTAVTDKYILDGHKPVPCFNLMKFARWFENANRHVAKTKIDDITISTVFLGLNHGFGKGPPLLFETMIFGGRFDEDMWRYSTWDEAEKGHQKAVEKVRANRKEKK
ncbi:MAG TPA: hypothetical protein ENH94_06285 [Phycisphaerales bacterium]|nr:hypothetical protein [Phycisphaerales bacterium]